MMAQKPCTVTELNNHIKLVLDNDPSLLNVCVQGELSNYKIYPSGHHYFTLKDTASSLRCVMFQSSAARLRFRPENGMKVVCTGRVSVFPRDGAYQLYTSSIQPDGVGDLYMAYEQLKEKLLQEGLFDPSHKKPLPDFPKRIAVITSAAGAAVRDVIRILGCRWPMAEVIVLPVRVQGEEAPAEIVGAIRYANRWKVADVIITGRGGGSIEDLWAFNDERVARAIFDSWIPVISAVGHEPDVTIADFVADVRASTPSNAAEIAVRDQQKMREQLAVISGRMSAGMENRFQSLHKRVESIAGRSVLESPYGTIRQRQQELDHIYDRLQGCIRERLSDKKNGFIRLTASMEALSPLKVMSRGYSMVTAADGGIVSDVKNISPGDSLHIQFAHGKAHCHVDTLEEEKA